MATTVTYDHRTDTLYVNYDVRASVDHSIEGDDGIVWRYDEQDMLIGVTMLSFTERLAEGKQIRSALVDNPQLAEEPSYAHRPISP